MRFPCMGRAMAACLLAAPLSGCSGCGSHAAPEGVEAGAAAPSGSAASGGWLNRRDPALNPAAPRGTSMYPIPKRDPDWDLDSSDPARDYARRYAFFTRRYGASLDCAIFGASQPAGKQRSVEVKNAPGCPGAGAVRDVFLVDVAGDRLTVDDKATRDPMGLWPDGSSPEGPPADRVQEILLMRDWKSPLKDAVARQSLVPVRVQGYGRGTYPVISVAGWHGAVQRGAPPEALQPLAEDLCRGNAGMPLGLFMAMDRTTLLRFRCPATTVWETL